MDEVRMGQIAVILFLKKFRKPTLHFQINLERDIKDAGVAQKEIVVFIKELTQKAYNPKKGFREMGEIRIGQIAVILVEEDLRKNGIRLKPGFRHDLEWDVKDTDIAVEEYTLFLEAIVHKVIDRKISFH